MLYGCGWRRVRHCRGRAGLGLFMNSRKARSLGPVMADPLHGPLFSVPCSLFPVTCRGGGCGVKYVAIGALSPSKSLSLLPRLFKIEESLYPLTRIAVCGRFCRYDFETTLAIRACKYP